MANDYSEGYVICKKSDIPRFIKGETYKVRYWKYSSVVLNELGVVQPLSDTRHKVITSYYNEFFNEFVKNEMESVEDDKDNK